MKHEVYAKYYQRKMKDLKRGTNACALIVGLVFLVIGIVFTLVWQAKFYR